MNGNNSAWKYALVEYWVGPTGKGNGFTHSNFDDFFICVAQLSMPWQSAYMYSFKTLY